jgi:hypothetical protein
LPGTNALAYYENLAILTVKGFIGLAPNEWLLGSAKRIPAVYLCLMPMTRTNSNQKSVLTTNIKLKKFPKTLMKTDKSGRFLINKKKTRLLK